jgi:hypothetical protein
MKTIRIRRNAVVLVIMSMTLFTALGPYSALSVASATRSSSAASSTEVDAVHIAMTRVLSHRGFLPRWALDIALRAYDAYQTYRNGQRVEKVRAQVLATLRVITELKADIEAGREMSDREYRLTRELLDSRMTHIETLISALSSRVDELERRVFRRGCGEYHYRRNGKCVDARKDH